MSSLLGDIILNIEQSNSILIKDSVHVTPGRNLLKCFASAKNIQSHVFVNEVDPCTWREGSYLYDNYTDPLHWDNDTSESQLSAASFVTSIAERIKTANTSLSNCILIDSLSVLLRRHGLSSVTKLLDALPGSRLSDGGIVSCVVFYLHGDVHDENDIQCLEQMVTTVISLEKSPVVGKQLCSITHLRRSGKLLHKRELFHIAADFTLSSTEYLASLDNIQSEEAVDPTVGLPFNLTLSDKEKKDRAHVVLPYKYTETQKAEKLGGRVFYQPDAVDDWDDSDPDDDLDI